MPKYLETPEITDDIAGRVARDSSAVVTLPNIHRLVHLAHGRPLVEEWKRHGTPDTFDGLFGPLFKAMGRRATIAKLAECDQELKSRGLVCSHPLTSLLRGQTEVLITAA
jgi:hypothetical protein